MRKVNKAVEGTAHPWRLRHPSPLSFCKKTIKQIAYIAIGIALYCSVVARGQDELQGVFSNEAEGFNTVTLMVHENGDAYFHAAVAGVIGKWSYDKPSSILTFNYFYPGPNKDASMHFTFDSKKRTYTLTGDGTETSTYSSQTLHYVTNAIPDQLIQAFKTYPKELKKHRQQTEAREKQRRKYEEKLAREKPEYEKIRTFIVENPHVVVSSDFYGRDDTPATRALKSTLGDRDVPFPEDVLVKMLEQLPPDNHWIREQIFARSEHSATTIEKYYPKALDWGARLNYGILVNIATHPNTPRSLVEDLALSTTLPGGAVGPAQAQVKQFAEDVLAGHTDTSDDSFHHLYELAIKMPTHGWTDNGKAILFALAKSPITPATVLARVADADDEFVQKAILSHANISAQILTQLSTSRFARVREAVLANPDIRPEMLLALSRDKEGIVRAAVAAHPATPTAILIEMQTDEYFDVRRNLIRNPNTPESVLVALASDSYAIIKSEAQQALSQRKKQNKQVNVLH
ncbi:MAG: hypothetical protein GX811_06120 [Lentisphaerae bacterium]|nr:hypothetical protein [Lentisphaerota bacterium]